LQHTSVCCVSPGLNSSALAEYRSAGAASRHSPRGDRHTDVNCACSPYARIPAPVGHPGGATNAIQVENLAKRYGTTVALDAIDPSLRARSVLA
jgi:hypothetical protein